MIVLIVALALLSAVAMVLGCAALHLASQRVKPFLVIGLSGVYFIGVFSLFARYASVFA